MADRSIFQRLDFFLLPLILIFTAVYYFIFYDFDLPPSEDAAMLIRYARNWADGHGITWNPGEAPLDGATDFLFMAVVAIFLKTGIPVSWAAKTIAAAAHFLTVFIVFRMNRRDCRSDLFSASLSAAYIAIGPGLVYIEASFGTTMFALFSLLAWREAVKIMENGYQYSSSALFGLFALLSSLTRPEGVFLCGLILLAIVWKRGLSGARSFRTMIVMVLILPGMAYFFWRWHYFGHPLPNPYYIKGSGSIYLFSLRKSVEHILILALPFLPTFLPGLFQSDMRKKLFALVIPVAGFAMVWILISNAMNYYMRFQYVLLPILLVSWYPFGGKIWDSVAKSPLSKLIPPYIRPAIILLILFSFPLLWQHFRYGYDKRLHRDGRHELGTALAEIKPGQLTMAVSEAGNLPLFSGWRTLDTWGLNDRRIAEEGALSKEYLRELNPDLVMFHDGKSPMFPRENIDPAWGKMVDTMEEFLKENPYELVGAFAVLPTNTHYYYVRTTSVGASEIRNLIGNFEYMSHETGEICNNYMEKP